MSAFLYFSQDKRREIKESNPTIRNTEISRILGEMWRNASEDVRRPHIEKEKEEREKYKIAIAKWRVEHEKKQEDERKRQADQAAYMSSVYHNEQVPGTPGSPHDPTGAGVPPNQYPPHQAGPAGYEAGGPPPPGSYPGHPPYMAAAPGVAPHPGQYPYGHGYPMYCKF